MTEKEKPCNNAELKSEKFRQILKLLDGVTYEEWDLFKRQIDRMFRLVQLNQEIPVNKDMVEYFERDMSDILKHCFNSRLSSAFQDMNR